MLKDIVSFLNKNENRKETNKRFEFFSPLLFHLLLFSLPALRINKLDRKRARNIQ